jgi:hypothetical protein
VAFWLSIAGLVATLVLGVLPLLRDRYIDAQKAAPAYAPKIEYVPITPPSDPLMPPLRVTMTQFMSLPWMFLVRRDMKLVATADIFTVWRITNLTYEEVQVDTLTVELIRRPPLVPVKLYLLRPDEAWVTYCGTRTIAFPCTFDNGFLREVLRSGIAPTHTVYGVGLFQVARGRGYSPSDVVSARAWIADVRGRNFDIEILLPRESSLDNLEESLVKTGHPGIDLSGYREESMAPHD